MCHYWLIQVILLHETQSLIVCNEIYIIFKMVSTFFSLHLPCTNILRPIYMESCNFTFAIHCFDACYLKTTIWNKLFLNVLLNKVNIFSTSSGNLTFFADNLLGYLATCHMICFLLFLCQMNHFLPFLNFWYIATVSDYIKESSIPKNLLAYLQRCCFPN